MDPTVLRLPRLDHGQDEPDFVLLHVASAGPRPLDLSLIGTESEAVFTASLKHDQTSELKAKGSTISQEEWEHILSAVLLGGRALEGVAAVAKVAEDASRITVIIRRSVEGITQWIGSLQILADETTVVQFYEWCGLLIKALEAKAQTLNLLRASVAEKDLRIQKLEHSFSELVNLKRESEAQLLEKFSLLLNEKKLKIRDQQRLLSTSTADPAKVAAVQESRAGSQPLAGSSKERKRKAGKDAREQSDEESEGFEKMEVDEPAEDSALEQAETTDESTADDPSEDEEPVPHPARRSASNSQVRNNNDRPTAHKSSAPAEDEVPEALPPKRTLPFSTVSNATPSLAHTSPVGSETETDDEL